MRPNIFISIVALTLAFASCQSIAQETICNAESVVFQEVDYLDVENNLVIKNQDVCICGDVIWKTGPSGAHNLPEGATIIEAKGKMLVPGLTEMHAHIPTPRDGDTTLVEETLFLYLSNGITTIRGMLGDPFHLYLRDAVAEGSVLGPRIFTSGPSFNGQSTPDIETARQKVKNQAAAGYDLLKLHPGLKREVFDAIVEEANLAGIDFSGHISLDVGVKHALENGYGSIDHLDGYVSGILKENANIAKKDYGLFGFNIDHKLLDPAKITELAKLTKEAGVWVVPTHSLLDQFFGPEPGNEMLKRAEVKFMPPATVANWVMSKNYFQNDKNYTIERAKAYLALRDKILLELYHAEVGLLLGSDAPQVFHVPGFSIHREIASMAEAGIPSIDILRSGTLNPSIFFGETDKYGQIKEGLSADLILLQGNPIDDLEHLKNPEGVMTRGIWLSDAEIQGRLEAISAKYANQ